MKTTNKGHSMPAGHGVSEVVRPAARMTSQVADEQIARERKYAEKLEDARQTMLRMSQNAAEQESVLAARLHDAQQVALRMSHEAAERARVLSDALKTARDDLTRQIQESVAVEREFRVIIAGGERERADLHDRFVKAVSLLDESEQALRQVFSRLSLLPGHDGTLAGPGDDADGLRQLLRLRGSDFLAWAYRLLLHRDPDEDGLQHYTGELRKGVSTAEIARRIRYSPEGRQVAVDVSGIRLRLALAALYRVPIIGRLAETIGDAGALIGSRREQRAFEHAVAFELARVRADCREASEALLQIAQQIAQVKSEMLVEPRSRHALNQSGGKQPGP